MNTIDPKVTSRATFNQLRAAEATQEAAAGPDAPKSDPATVSRDTLLAHASAVGTTSAKLDELVKNAGMGDEIDEGEMDALFAQALDGQTPAPPEERFALPPGQVLMEGQTASEPVKQLQTALAGLNDPSGKPYFAFQGETLSGPTGNFHGVTEAAVKAFQADHGLPPDGKVGPKTAEALNAALAAQAAVAAVEPPVEPPADQIPMDTVIAPAPAQTLEEQAIANGDPAVVEQAIKDAGTDPTKLGRVHDLLPDGDPRKAALLPLALGQVTGEAAQQIVNALQDQVNTPEDFQKAAMASGGDPVVMQALADVARYKATLNQDQGHGERAAEMQRLSAAFSLIAKASEPVRKELAMAFDGSGNGGDFQRALAAATTPADADALTAWLSHNTAVEADVWDWFKSIGDPQGALGQIAAFRATL